MLGEVEPLGRHRLHQPAFSTSQVDPCSRGFTLQGSQCMVQGLRFRVSGSFCDSGFKAIQCFKVFVPEEVLNDAVGALVRDLLRRRDEVRVVVQVQRVQPRA